MTKTEIEKCSDKMSCLINEFHFCLFATVSFEFSIFLTVSKPQKSFQTLKLFEKTKTSNFRPMCQTSQNYR